MAKAGGNVWIGFNGAYEASSTGDPKNRPPPQQPRVIPAASADEVMIEQLESLIAHVNGVICGCHQCDRYLKIRELLLSAMG